MKKLHPLRLEARERAHLKKLLRRDAATPRIQTKARILLLCDMGSGRCLRDSEVAALASCCSDTVVRTRRRFLEEGLEAALRDRPRWNRPSKLGASGHAQLLSLACSTPPGRKRRWTLQSLADELVASGAVESFSAVAVHKRLKRMGLRPAKQGSRVAS